VLSTIRQFNKNKASQQQQQQQQTTELLALSKHVCLYLYLSDKRHHPSL